MVWNAEPSSYHRANGRLEWACQTVGALYRRFMSETILLSIACKVNRDFTQPSHVIITAHFCSHSVRGM